MEFISVEYLMKYVLLDQIMIMFASRGIPHLSKIETGENYRKKVI